MARSGSLAALEQRLAVQRREDDRLARERRQRAGEQERLRQQEHRESQEQAADDKTAAVQERMKALDEVLTSVLPLRPLSFDRLMSRSADTGIRSRSLWGRASRAGLE